MIEQLLGFGAVFWQATQTNSFFNRPIDHLSFRRGGENLIKRRVDSCLIDFFQPQIALQSLSTDWSLLDAQGSIALREPRIIQIAVLAQAFDYGINNRLSRASAFQ